MAGGLQCGWFSGYFLKASNEVFRLSISAFALANAAAFTGTDDELPGAVQVTVIVVMAVSTVDTWASVSLMMASRFVALLPM